MATPSCPTCTKLMELFTAQTLFADDNRSEAPSSIWTCTNRRCVEEGAVFHQSSSGDLQEVAS